MKKFILCCSFVLICTIFFSCGNQSIQDIIQKGLSGESIFSSPFESYDTNGYDFVISQLKSPSSAQLIRYWDKDNIAQSISRNGLNKPLSLDAEMYEIDAQNSYGVMLRSTYICFFEDGTPTFCTEIDNEGGFDTNPNFKLFWVMHFSLLQEAGSINEIMNNLLNDMNSGKLHEFVENPYMD